VRYRCRSRDLVPGSPYAATPPANVRIEQAEVLDLIAEWMADLFAPGNIETTTAALVDATRALNLANARSVQLRQRLRDAETRLGRLHDSIEAGVDPASLVPRINAVQSKIDALTSEIRLRPASDALSTDDVAGLILEVADC
jgi:hypothetical protein